MVTRTDQRGEHDLYVAPDGSDRWSGMLAEPNAAKTDGPLATIQEAQKRLRRHKKPVGEANRLSTASSISASTTVWIRRGRYPIAQPLVFGPEDSAPVTYAAYPGETPILHGGERISNWRSGEINGCKAWIADLPEVATGQWYFRQLFVNGRVARRPRLPRQGLYRMQEVPGMPLPAGWGSGGYTQFVCAPGDVRSFENLTDVEVVYVHFWIEERSPIASFDVRSHTVTMERPSQAPLVGSHGHQLADYYLGNVKEALSEPGEWYLDRSDGRLVYLPLPGEDPETTEVYAPRAMQLLQIVGEPDTNRFVEHVRFQGLAFECTDWRHPDEVAKGKITSCSAERFSRGHCAAAPQAAVDIPGVVYLEGARYCGLEHCTIRNVGWYGIEVADGCLGVQIIGCELTNLGAGGIKINGADAQGPDTHRTGYCRVTDNHIHNAGLVFHSGVGILVMHSFSNLIAHNHIHDLFYTGIFCGWVWGYGESISRDNVIEKNHIHGLGKELLSDMGGIYTLGVQPGTVLRGNLIHDINKAHYGAWCIYPDEGSSHLVIENNICYNTNSQVFHQHYGRENIVRNNIFAFGSEALLAYSRITEGSLGFSMLRNIIITDQAPVFTGGYNCRLSDRSHISDLNVLYDISGRPLSFGHGDQSYTLGEWQVLGHDRHSVIADPKCKDPRHGDFTLAEDSPALALGFQPIDTSDVGPRPRDKRH
jgi:hypothetical protein